MTRVLLVDDDPRLRLALTKALSRKGVDVFESAGGTEVVDALKTGSTRDGPVDVCLLDLRMPGLSGLEILRKTVGRKIPVVVLTGHGTVPDAVEAMRLGAVNFMQKPVDADGLLPVLKDAVHKAVHQETEVVHNTLLGASKAMLDFLHRLDRCAEGNDAVLIVGESGTGKELCARRLHSHSAHKRGPFVHVTPQALLPDGCDAELFGQRKGGDVREGAFYRAQEGTLFIDEVADLPLDTQAQLLRALEQQRYRPLFSDAERPVKARVVASTQRDLKALVEAGAFRADLYFRLSAVSLTVPPLRERGDDVVLLARAALARESADTGDKKAQTFSPAAEDRLRDHPFMGNVRELYSLTKRAALFATGPVVEVALVEQLLKDSPFAVAKTQAGHAPRAGERVTLEELEKTHIRRLLDELDNVSEVARIVGIDRRTLQRKMAAWGFRDKGEAPSKV